MNIKSLTLLASIFAATIFFVTPTLRDQRLEQRFESQPFPKRSSEPTLHTASLQPAVGQSSQQRAAITPIESGQLAALPPFSLGQQPTDGEPRLALAPQSAPQITQADGLAWPETPENPVGQYPVGQLSETQVTDSRNLWPSEMNGVDKRESVGATQADPSSDWDFGLGGTSETSNPVGSSETPAPSESSPFEAASSEEGQAVDSFGDGGQSVQDARTPKTSNLARIYTGTVQRGYGSPSARLAQNPFVSSAKPSSRRSVLKRPTARPRFDNQSAAIGLDVSSNPEETSETAESVDSNVAAPGIHQPSNSVDAAMVDLTSPPATEIQLESEQPEVALPLPETLPSSSSKWDSSSLGTDQPTLEAPDKGPGLLPVQPQGAEAHSDSRWSLDLPSADRNPDTPRAKALNGDESAEMDLPLPESSAWPSKGPSDDSPFATIKKALSSIESPDEPVSPSDSPNIVSEPELLESGTSDSTPEPVSTDSAGSHDSDRDSNLTGTGPLPSPAATLAQPTPQLPSSMSEPTPVDGVVHSTVDNYHASLTDCDAVAGCDAVGGCDEGVHCDDFGNTCDGGLGIDFGGWFSAGYHSASNDLFNNRPDRFALHQGWLYAERHANEDNPLGFRVDVMYGIDADDTQAFGNNAGEFDFQNGLDFGSYGWAIPQAYIDVALGDWNIRAGHFFTLLGYEVVPARDNFFYSHAMTMYNSEPFTHTGILANRQVGPMNFFAGWTLGWDTGFDQFGGGSSWLGGVTYDWNDCVSISSFSTSGDFGRRGDQAYSSSLVVDVQLTESLNYVFQSDQLRVRSTGEDNVGINQYLFYTLSDQWSIGTRIEWWKGDVLTGYAPHGGVLPAAGSLSYYAATLGLNYRPLESLAVRPEIRHDWSPAANYEETYFGVDAIWSF